MREADAESTLVRRVDAGGRLQVAASGDLPTLKRLRSRCLGAGIPVMFGPPVPGG
jgi:hypothetical protein